ncbi:MAG: cytochrome P450 [Sphingomonadales bacterium]
MNKPLSEYNFFDPELIEDPFDFYQAAMEEAPVYNIPGTNIFLVTKYDIIAGALKRYDVFSNNFGIMLEGQSAKDPEIQSVLEKGWPQANTLLTNDPPSHTRFRKLVNLAFSMKRVATMEDYMRQTANALIDQFIDDGECEFMQSMAIPMPVMMIAEQLGADKSEWKTIKRWTDAFADRIAGTMGKERELECAQLVVDFQHYMFEKLEARKTNPQDDLLTDLVQARIDGEQPLTDAELLSICQQLMVAGNETTTNTMAGGLLLLIQNAAEQAKARDNRKLIPNMVEEILRLESATSGMWRVVLDDTELEGVQIPKGSMLHLRYAAGNRDPEKFENPNAFIADRKNANKQMAFGQGIHVCVGQMLSRKELAVAYDILFDRMENIKLAEGKNCLTHMPNMMLRGLKSLHITFDKKA